MHVHVRVLTCNHQTIVIADTGQLRITDVPTPFVPSEEGV